MTRRYYLEHQEESDQGRLLLIVLLITIGVWWGIVHFLDWLTMDIVPWWLEILSFVPFCFLCAMVVLYGRNPLYWWPAVWGVRVKISDDFLFHINYDENKFVKKYGGPLNVWVNNEYVKFRRKKDAVTFCLMNL
jgi:hypothetical protein